MFQDIIAGVLDIQERGSSNACCQEIEMGNVFRHADSVE